MTQEPRRGRPPASEQVDRRDALLKSAIKLFAERGFSAVDLREISKDAGVTVGLIRHYFDNKEGLIDEAIANVIDQLQAVFGQVTADIDASSGYEFIDLLSQRHDALLYQRYELLQFLKHLAVEMTDKSGPIFKSYYKHLNSEVLELQRRWGLPSKIDPSWLTFTLMFIQLGPIFLTEQMKAIMGFDKDDKAIMTTRTVTSTEILKHGIVVEKKSES
ncbi:TetR/AcrR family transcriptional regulator [Parasphingorhabdus halotolerans]|uniref:TetR/AcrR family transcriptional regulator n=1 Tax=Parasphingorhabdus halotolerans TaxID=2725558 RepID=A0A6H2DIN5_9SPHN|nr:TetR/AcrR family transcriptional regulator [Parasphingorhabdus halotolerans]